jgi:heme-degrading monooxygenase HmoA
MIARLWSAQASKANAPRYAEHLRRHVLPAVRSLEGFEGATLLERDREDHVEILVITWWRALDDVRAFAGAELDVAVVAEDAQVLLDRFDADVRHFRIVLDEPAPPLARPR